MLQRINYDEEYQAFYVDDDGMFCDAYAALAEIAALKARIAALEAMKQWQPVEDGFEYADGGVHLYVNGGDVEMNNDANEGDRWVILPDDLRLCRFAPADWVDWEKVPDGYDWVAADANGDPFAYTHVPQKGPTFWSSASEYTSCPTLGILPLGLDWRQSLRRRPS